MDINRCTILKVGASEGEAGLLSVEKGRSLELGWAGGSSRWHPSVTEAVEGWKHRKGNVALPLVEVYQAVVY